MNRKELLTASLVSLTLIVLLDLLTDPINTTQNEWDFIYYIAMAKDGFNADPLASPFAYRFFTTGLVNLLFKLGLSIENGFRLTAYLGAFTQLTGIFLFIHWLTRSARGAWIALFVTAFSLFNIKFLLFDIYRPDHLAYALILLQTYFAFEKNFVPLLLLTLIGSTMREFTLIPLFAYLFMLWWEHRASTIWQGLVSALCIFPAVLLPRILIPVAEDFQIVGFSPDKLLNTILLPFIPSFPVNFVFSIFAYLLPLFLLANPRDIKSAFQNLEIEKRRYLVAYTSLVLMLSFFGGTDFNRFATFLFLPQIILVGWLAPGTSKLKLTIVFACLFIFNRLWMLFPDWDVQAYRNFYGGFALQLNGNTAYRFVELFLFLIVSSILNRKR